MIILTIVIRDYNSANNQNHETSMMTMISIKRHKNHNDNNDISPKMVDELQSSFTTVTRNWLHRFHKPFQGLKRYIVLGCVGFTTIATGGGLEF